MCTFPWLKGPLRYDSGSQKREVIQVQCGHRVLRGKIWGYCTAALVMETASWRQWKRWENRCTLTSAFGSPILGSDIQDCRTMHHSYVCGPKPLSVWRCVTVAVGGQSSPALSSQPQPTLHPARRSHLKHNQIVVSPLEPSAAPFTPCPSRDTSCHLQAAFP